MSCRGSAHPRNVAVRLGLGGVLDVVEDAGAVNFGQDADWEGSAHRFLELYVALLGGTPPRDEWPLPRGDHPMTFAVRCDAARMGG